MEVAFRRYRIMSFVTGTTLLTLFAMLLLHTVDLSAWKHIEILVKIDGIAHGIVHGTVHGTAHGTVHGIVHGIAHGIYS